MGSEVYFANTRAKFRETSLLNKISRLFKRAGFEEIIKKDNLVAVKLHFGEAGNTGFVRPIYVRKIVDQIKKKGAKPFLTDANTLYRGMRKNAVDHLNTAIANGFSYATVGAQVIIADGLRGKSFTEVEINKKHFKRAKISNEVYYADALMVITHFKGHGGTGFGGTVKNVGMGIASPAGKQMMHANVLPSVNKEVCIGCGTCKRWCPTGAISIMWDESAKNLHEKMVEYVYAVLKDKQDKVGFFSFLMDITPDCDCAPWSDASIVPDIGIMASKDPVAIEQASLDLVNAEEGLKDTALKRALSSGEDKFKDLYPTVDTQLEIEYAEKLNLGTREYELIEV